MCCGANQRVSSRERPLLIGEIDPDETVLRVRATVNVYGLKPGQQAFVTGLGVQTLLLSKSLVVAE